MLQLDYKSSESLYIQIKENIKKLILTNSLKENEMLPSVRSLASNLAINVNTVQRAYKELELEGFIYSIQGKGNFVAKMNDEITKKATDELKHKLKLLIKESEYLGFKKEDVINMIKEL